MPLYTYKNPKTGEHKDIFQSMNEEHTHQEDGVDWDRVFYSPFAAIDTEIDINSARDFSEKTGKKKGTIGDIWDKSQELSEKRADKLGYDPVRKKALEDYSKVRRGKKHISETSNTAVEI